MMRNNKDQPPKTGDVMNVWVTFINNKEMDHVHTTKSAAAYWWSGYFSDDHFEELRRKNIIRFAKRKFVVA